MKLKSELYKEEQEEVINKLINIIKLNNDNSLVLYDLDHDETKQQEILNLIPDIRKYFSFTSIIGASEPDKSKRPYLSIIKQLIKSKYNIISSDFRIKDENNKEIRTKKYFFIKK
jgi:hypothetical protein